MGTASPAARPPFLHVKGSVDIDLDYIGNVDRDIKQVDRKAIRNALLVILRNLDHSTEKPILSYAEERFDAHFIEHPTMGMNDALSV
jgi:hypothetical protein